MARAEAATDSGNFVLQDNSRCRKSEKGHSGVSTSTLLLAKLSSIMEPPIGLQFVASAWTLVKKDPNVPQSPPLVRHYPNYAQVGWRLVFS